MFARNSPAAATGNSALAGDDGGQPRRFQSK